MSVTDTLTGINALRVVQAIEKDRPDEYQYALAFRVANLIPMETYQVDHRGSRCNRCDEKLTPLHGLAHRRCYLGPLTHCGRVPHI